MPKKERDKVRRFRGEGSICYLENKKCYRGRVSLGKDSTGKSIVKDLYGKSPEEVIAKVDKVKRESFGLKVDFNNITFGEWFYKWLYGIKKSEIAESSFNRYESLYEKYIGSSIFNDTRLQEVTSFDIKSWYSNITDEKGTTDNTLSYINDLLHSAFLYAKEQRIILDDPTAKIKFKKTQKPNEDDEVWSEDEQKKVTEYLKESSFEDEPLKYMILFTLATGLRLGEIQALTWKDIDLKKLIIKVNKSLKKRRDKDNKKQFYEVGQTKTAEIREVKLPSSFKNILDEMIEYKNNNENNPMNLVFPDETTGNWIYYKKPNRHVEYISKKVGVKVITFHHVRSTYATRLFEKNVPIKVVQKLLGHSDIKTTQDIYTKVMKDYKDKSVDALNDLF